VTVIKQCEMSYMSKEINVISVCSSKSFTKNSDFFKYKYYDNIIYRLPRQKISSLMNSYSDCFQSIKSYDNIIRKITYLYNTEIFHEMFYNFKKNF